MNCFPGRKFNISASLPAQCLLIIFRLIQLLMKKLFLRILISSLCFIIISLHVIAQQGVIGSVSGSVSDTSSKQSMNGATIALFDMNDSNASPKYETAKARGAFAIHNIAEGRYRL